MQDKMTRAANAVLAYGWEQGYSTFFLPWSRLSRRLGEGESARTEHSDFLARYDGTDTIEEYEVESAQMLGAGIGIAQDIACLTGSLLYMSGVDSRWCAVAAGITAVKLATNAAAAGGDLLYRMRVSMKQNGPLEYRS